jgi:hypothetical protein
MKFHPHPSRVIIVMMGSQRVRCEGKGFFIYSWWSGEISSTSLSCRDCNDAGTDVYGVKEKVFSHIHGGSVKFQKICRQFLLVLVCWTSLIDRKMPLATTVLLHITKTCCDKIKVCRSCEEIMRSVQDWLFVEQVQWWMYICIHDNIMNIDL